MRSIWGIPAVVLVLCLIAVDPVPAGKPLRSLVEDLQSSDWRIRRQAAEALGALGPRAAEAAPVLTAALKDWRVRAAAGRALVKIGMPTVPGLLNVLTKDEDRGREQVLQALARMGPEVVPLLLKAIRDRNPRLRNGAIEALARRDPPPQEALPVLLATLVRPQLQLVLWPSSNDEFGYELVVEHDAEGSRSAAAKALGLFGAKAVPALLHALRADLATPSPSVLPGLGWSFARPERKQAIRRIRTLAVDDPPAFGRWFGRQLVSAREELRNSHRATRTLALEALSAVGHREGSYSPKFSLFELRLIVPALTNALKDPDVGIRLKASRFLADLGPSARTATAGLLDALKDRSYIPPPSSGLQPQNSVQLYAVRALLSLGAEAEDRLAREGMPILTAALEDRDPFVRQYAVEGLEMLGWRAESAVPRLLSLIHDEYQRRQKSPSHREKAMESLLAADAGTSATYVLASIGPAAVSPLCEWLQGGDRELCLIALQTLQAMTTALQSRDGQIRAAAAQALGAIGRQSHPAIPALRKALRDSDVLVRYEAAMALLKIEPFAHDAVRVLADLLRAKKDRIPPANVLRTLRELGAKARTASPVLEELLRLAEEEPDRREVALTLAQVDPDAREIARRFLAAKASKGDWRAAQAIVEIDPADRHILPVFLGVLEKTKDHDEAIPLILNTLGTMRGHARPAVPVLVRLLSDEAYRYNVIGALEEIGPAAEDAIPALIKLLESGEELHEQIIRALGRIGLNSKEVLPVLLSLLDEPDEPQCLWAVHALGHIGPAAKPALPRLRELMENKNVRVAASEAVIRITGQEGPALEVLIAVLNDPSDNRLAAAVALVPLGPKAKAAVPGLRAALKERNEPELCSAAAQALGAIGPEARPAVRDLLLLLEDRNHPARHDAVIALGDIGVAEAIPPLVVLLQQEQFEQTAEAAELALNKLRAVPRRRW
jgi:HEAT repeat protein